MTQKDRVLKVTVDARVLLVVLLALALLVGGSVAARATTPPDPNSPEAEQPAAPAAAPAQQAPSSDSLYANGESGSVAAAENVEARAPDAVAAFGGGRRFYLTDFNRVGNTALTACAAGYHMASLWEIYDVSNLIYNYTHADAYNKADSGRSVPSHWYGWVRTGYDSSTANTAGTANCSAWTSANGAHFGTIARLNYNWDVSVSAIPPWEPDTWTCGGLAPVWCVEN